MGNELPIPERNLYAASELGDHRVVSLATLQSSRCDLLREVWAEVPVVWERGRPARRPPPSGHECAF